MAYIRTLTFAGVLALTAVAASTVGVVITTDTAQALPKIRV